MDETPIKITIADTVITARLANNATARDLAAQLRWLSCLLLSSGWTRFGRVWVGLR